MRLKKIQAIFIASFLILISGLYYTQIHNGGKYYQLSQKNRIRLVTIEGCRGRMYDRNNKLIVDNIISYDIIATPQEIPDKERSIESLSKIVNKDPGELRRIYKKGYLAPFAPIVLQKNVPKAIAFILEELQSDFTGISVASKPLRKYIYGKDASHITGYLGQINKEELTRLKPYGYEVKDYVGRSGLEKYFDTYLKNQDGGMQVEVDNMGKQVDVLGYKKPVNGMDVYLTIDIDIQLAASRILADRRGCIIVMDANTGEIIALSSGPGFDPNVFVRGADTDEIENILESKMHPLINRSIASSFLPGSIFKIVTAGAGLETGAITPSTTFDCDGAFKAGKATFRCWKKEGHGPQDLRLAIAHSCNVYFYNAGLLTGVENLSAYANCFGLGRLTGIDLPGETKGLIPTKNWKKQMTGFNWVRGDTINLSIGQGYCLISPIQAIRMVSVVANGGYLLTPFLVRRVGNLDVGAPKPVRAAISDATLGIIKNDLRGVVALEDGTARQADIEGLDVSGKTGTAQAGRSKHHAWFVGFFPYEKPRYSFVAFLEESPGGYEAAYMMSELLKYIKEKGYINVSQ